MGTRRAKPAVRVRKVSRLERQSKLDSALTPPAPPSDDDSSNAGGAFESGDSAAGLARSRPGIAESPAYDRLFALGWPNIVLVGGEAASIEERVALSNVGVGRRRVWPGSALGALVRFWALPPEAAFGMDAHGRGARHDSRGRPIPSAGGRAVLASEAPLDVAEAERILGELLSRSWLQVPVLRNVLRITEAAVGTSVVVRALVGALESWPREAWTGIHHHGYQAVFELVPLRERLARQEESDVTSALERLFQRVVEEAFGTTDPPPRGPREIAAPLRALDVVLHGVEGAKRSGWGRPAQPMAREELGWVRDGGDFIVETMRQGKALDPLPDVRRVFEGGDPVIEVESASWRSIAEADDQRVVIETYGVLATALIVPWFVDMAANSRVKSDVLAWFRRRRDFAEPELARLADGSGALAAAARALRASSEE